MSLKAWYPLIDGSLENKGLDTTPLTLYGTVPFTNGRVRTAPTFSANESNYYTMPPITKVNDFSICCWVKISADVSVLNWIVWQGVASNDNRFGFIYLGGTNSIGFRMGSFIQNSTIEKDKWYHLCMTMNDTNTVVCYINGNTVGTGLYEGYSFTENETLYLGRSNYNINYEPLNGQLQDFRYYDHCLSPKEVKEIAKGLCLHLPLKGTNARPNLFKNSATMFDYVGHYNSALSTAELVFDETSPCGTNGKVLKLSTHRNADYTYHYAGTYYLASETNMDKLEIGKTYCVSIWIKGDTNETSLILNGLAERQTILKLSNEKVTPEWKRYYAIFTAKNETFTMAIYLLYSTLPQTGNVNWSVCCPKLELLSPTPYIPNVNDTQYSDYVLDYEPDCSGNEFDATKYGDLTTSDSNGRYNTAVAFNGTNTYLQGLAPTNSECKEFTIATWVKLNDVSVSHTIYACRTVVEQGIALFYSGASGILFDDGVRNAIFSNSTLEPNKWYHIAVTRDTTERKLYINGEFVSSGTTAGTLTNMGTMYQVGESNAQTGEPKDNYLNGSLSDFRLYTSVLSADDVKELYETSVSIAHNPPSLTESAYYNYVEGQKHSTFDKSKFTVVGSPTITDDGVASGFVNDTNYISIPFYPERDFTLDITLYLGAYNDMAGQFVYNGLGFYRQKDAAQRMCFAIYYPCNTQFLAFVYFEENSKLRVIIDKKGLNINTKFCTNDGEFTTAKPATLNSNTNNYTNLTFGQKGSGIKIDLKLLKISYDGKEVFSGNKTGLDVIKPDNYTVVGSPDISDDGVASGFSASNYLNIANQISSLTKPYKISCIITPQTGSTNQNAWSMLMVNYQNMIRIMQRSTNSLTFSVYKDNVTSDLASTQTLTIGQPYIVEAGQTRTKMFLRYKKVGDTTWIEDLSRDKDLINFTSITTARIGQAAHNTTETFLGYIDLNSFKIYVDGNLVYQPCLKIPYTESKAGTKVVDSTYLDRVKDVYDQHYLERYYTVDETTQTVYEYPLFRDSMHAYEFDEGLQASITKNGIHNATTLTEATKTSMYQNNTDTVALIEI